MCIVLATRNDGKLKELGRILAPLGFELISQAQLDVPSPVEDGAQVPFGESCMWGDYHLREVAVYVQRLANDQPYYTFFGPTES